MEATQKQALIDLLLFKFGVTNTFDNTGKRLEEILIPIKQRPKPGMIYFMVTGVCTDVILKCDIAEGYVVKNGDVYTRKPRDTNDILVYHKQFNDWLTAAANKVVNYIEDLQNRVMEPLCDPCRKYTAQDAVIESLCNIPYSQSKENNVREYLDAPALIRTIYLMPVLRGIYFSEDKQHEYWCEITKKELLNIADGSCKVLCQFDEDKLRICSVEEAKVIAKQIHRIGNHTKYYIARTTGSLGFANTTYKEPVQWRCNRFYLCQNLLLKNMKELAQKDDWEDNGYYKETFYHELAHCFFGHGPNKTLEYIIKDGNTEIEFTKSEMVQLFKVEIIDFWNEQDAQTFASVFFSDVSASKHIKEHSKNKSYHYRGMPLWRLYTGINKSYIGGPEIDFGSVSGKIELRDMFEKEGYKFPVPASAANNRESVSNITYAKKNDPEDVYWSTPKASLLTVDWVLILDDIINRTLYYFLIPANTLKASQFRLKKGGAIHIEIIYDDKDFTDKFKGIKFLRFYKGSIKY